MTVTTISWILKVENRSRVDIRGSRPATPLCRPTLTEFDANVEPGKKFVLIFDIPSSLGTTTHYFCWVSLPVSCSVSRDLRVRREGVGRGQKQLLFAISDPDLPVLFTTDND